MMTLHPSEGRAGDSYGHLEATEQHQQVAATRDSWGNSGIPTDSAGKTGYADVESKERFPHPHSLDDGGEMKKPIVKMGAGRLPSIAESEITRVR
jgi:hypothetical protein